MSYGDIILTIKNSPKARHPSQKKIKANRRVVTKASVTSCLELISTYV